MDPTLFIVGAIVLLVLVGAGGVLVAILLRSAYAGTAAAQARVQQLTTDLEALQRATSALERDLAVEQQKASHAAALERESAEKSRLLDAAREGKSAAESNLARASEALGQTERRLTAAAQQVSTLENDAKATRRDLADLQAAHATLKETLAQQAKQADEKLALLAEARDRMTREFKVLADDLMKEHGKAFADHNKEQIGGMLAPLHTKLGEFQQGLQSAHTDSAKERATLAE